MSAMMKFMNLTQITYANNCRKHAAAAKNI